jgi:hypothetical protein
MLLLTIAGLSAREMADARLLFHPMCIESFPAMREGHQSQDVRQLRSCVEPFPAYGTAGTTTPLLNVKKRLSHSEYTTNPIDRNYHWQKHRAIHSEHSCFEQGAAHAVLPHDLELNDDALPFVQSSVQGRI